MRVCAKRPISQVSKQAMRRHHESRRRNHTQPATPLATMPAKPLASNLHSPSGDNGWIGRPKRIRTGYGWSYRIARGSKIAPRRFIGLLTYFARRRQVFQARARNFAAISSATIQRASNAVNIAQYAWNSTSYDGVPSDFLIWMRSNPCARFAEAFPCRRRSGPAARELLAVSSYPLFRGRLTRQHAYRLISASGPYHRTRRLSSPASA